MNFKNYEPNTSPRLRVILTLTVVLLLALTLRLISLHNYHFVGADGGIDGVSMAWAGKNLLSGRGLSVRGRPETIHSPLFPILVGLMWRLVGNLELAGQLVSVLVGTLAIIPVFFLARLLFGHRVALLSSLLTAVFPAFVYASTEIRLASLYMLLTLIVGFSIYQNAILPTGKRGIFAGLAIGLAYLTRPEAFFYLPLAFLLPLLIKGRKWGRKIKGTILSGVGIALSFSLISSPYWIFLHRHLDHWTLSGRGPYTFVSYFGDTWEKSNFFLYAYQYKAMKQWLEKGGGIGFVREHYQEMLGNFIRNVASFIDLGNSPQFKKIGISRYAIDSLIVLAIIFFLGIVIRKLFKRQWQFRDTFLLLFCAPVLQYLVLSARDLRYFYAYLPFGLIILAACCLAGARRVSESKKLSSWGRGLIAWGPSGVIVMITLAGSIFLISRKVRTVPYEYKLLGLWMKEQVPEVEASTVMSRKMGVPFYAGARHVLIFPGSYEEVLKYAKESRADYLVIDEWTIPGARPTLVFLLRNEDTPPELDKVHTAYYQGRKIVLYKFKLNPANE